IAISPDGRHIVFSGTKGDVTQLYLRSVDQEQPTPIAGTEGGHNPFFSPDGQMVGFWADQKLKRIPISGGPASVICDAAAGAFGIWGGSWSDDGTIVFSGFATPNSVGLFSVSAAGGLPNPVPHLDEGFNTVLPHFLPGGKTLLFTSVKGVDWANAKIEAL